jgi:ABC-type glycerol-3-phosphate transport system substrate-binding protein
MHASLSMRGVAAAGLVTLAILFGAPRASAQDVTLEVWSHEADEPAKVAFRELAVKNFEKSHPGTKVKITWYEKNPLGAALKTALPAGEGGLTSLCQADRSSTSPRITSFRSMNW